MAGGIVKRHTELCPANSGAGIDVARHEPFVHSLRGGERTDILRAAS